MQKGATHTDMPRSHRETQKLARKNVGDVMRRRAAFGEPLLATTEQTRDKTTPLGFGYQSGCPQNSVRLDEATARALALDQGTTVVWCFLYKGNAESKDTTNHQWERCRVKQVIKREEQVLYALRVCDGDNIEVKGMRFYATHASCALVSPGLVRVMKPAQAAAAGETAKL